MYQPRQAAFGWRVVRFKQYIRGRRVALLFVNRGLEEFVISVPVLYKACVVRMADEQRPVRLLQVTCQGSYCELL